jgi:hypothetical protein
VRVGMQGSMKPGGRRCPAGEGRNSIGSIWTRQAMLAISAYPCRSTSARRPASVILTRVTSTGLPPPKTRSGVAVANSALTMLMRTSSLKPCARRRASVAPSSLAASSLRQWRSSSVVLRSVFLFQDIENAGRSNVFGLAARQRSEDGGQHDQSILLRDFGIWVSDECQVGARHGLPMARIIGQNLICINEPRNEAKKPRRSDRRDQYKGDTNIGKTSISFLWYHRSKVGHVQHNIEQQTTHCRSKN